MKDYKTVNSRLVTIFKSARDNWKDKALFRQKKIRVLEIKVRDLHLSRDKWKEKALKFQADLANQEAILKAKEAEIELLKKKINHLESLQKLANLDNNSP